MDALWCARGHPGLYLSSQPPQGQSDIVKSDWLALPFNVVIFLDTTDVINDKLCMMVLPIELNLLITLSVTLTIINFILVSN